MEKSLITEADDLYSEKRFDELYDALHAHRDSGDVEILWRLSRASFEKGKASSSGSDKLRFFEEGMTYVNRGLGINENHAVLYKVFVFRNSFARKKSPL